MSTTVQKAIKETLNSSYRVVVKSVHPRGKWGSSEISIYTTGALFKRRLGGYVRNYPGHGLGTWYPFSRGDRDYALYSPNYTCTRIMELPSCKDIGGEEPHSGGFCAVEYFIPKIAGWDKQPDPSREGSSAYRLKKTPSDVAFVSGCIWGDDSSWKIQCFDLSQVELGIITRDERFGYIAIPRGISLENSVSLEWDEETGSVVATLAVMQHFDLLSGELTTVDPFA